MKRRLVIRGSVAIVASVAIVLLIRAGIAEPHPDLVWAYIGCAAVGLWGLIDLIRGLFGHQP